MAQKRRNKAAEAATMFEVTSMSSEQISAIPAEQKETLVNDLVEKKIDAEIEKAHDEEIAEAKELGIEDKVIVESTKNEISKDFEKQLEECQARYLEAVDDKKKAEKENEKLNKKILALSSEIDVLKTDASREISNCKVEIADLNETIKIYKANEINYKAEISALKTDLATLEASLDEANKIINKNGQKPVIERGRSNRAVPMFLTKNKQQIKKRPPSTNGYSSWN